MNTTTNVHKRRNEVKSEDNKPPEPQEVDSTSFKPKDEKEKKFDLQALLNNGSSLFFFMVLIIGPFIYYFITTEPTRSLAKVLETVNGRGQKLNCSSNYTLMIKQYPRCLPPQCQRYTTDNMINSLESDTLLKVAQKGFVKKGPFGGASVLYLFPGAKSMGKDFINVQELKDTDKVFTEIDSIVYENVIEKIRHGIGQIYKIDPDKLHLTHPSYFMELVKWKAGERVDKYWHLKFDAENYIPFDYSATVFLNDYRSSFQGGKVMFNDEPIRTSLEPKKGRVLIYNTGPENRFSVETVSIGERYTMTISFTCNEKNAIKDVRT